MFFKKILVAISVLLLSSCLVDEMQTVYYRMDIINTTEHKIVFSSAPPDAIYKNDLFTIVIPPYSNWTDSWSVTDVVVQDPIVPSSVEVLVDETKYLITNEMIIPNNPLLKEASYEYHIERTESGYSTHCYQYIITNQFIDAIIK